MLGRCWGSIKPLHAKAETPVFVNKLCQRLKPISFVRISGIAHCARLTSGRGISTRAKTQLFRSTEREEGRAEVGISLSTLERNYGIYLDKTVQEKVQQEVRRNRGRKQKAMIQRRVMASPTGFEPVSPA